MNNLSRNSGFTLIELLISVAIALIVTGSAIALMVSIMQANGQNIASTRLTQELRAVAEVVARDIKRARYMEDGIGFVGERQDDDNGDGVVDADDYWPVNPYEQVTVLANASADDGDVATTDGICIQYAYEGAENGAFRSAYLGVDAGGVGAVFLARADVAPGCGRGTRLSSPEVNISQLAFNFNETDDWLRITISGFLRSDTAVRRQITTSVRFRSQQAPAPAP